MERRTLMRWAAAAVLLVTVAAAGVAVVARPTAATRPDAIAPLGVRIRVEVLNATPRRGLARRATAFLRDRGFDVVQVATAPQLRDSTLILHRSGNPAWAQLVARALGGARVESRPDTSRYLDVTVLIGRDWAPPADPFYP